LEGFSVTDAEMSGPGATAQAQPPLPEGEGADPRVAELEAQLANLSSEAGKARDEWLRAKAETDNVRRRAQEDVAKAHRYGIEGFAGALLAVKDSLDAALTVENTSIESFKEGVELTARQLEAVFQKFAVSVISPEGEKFDPHRHQAISQVESDKEPGTVVTVLQKGYLLHDRVLRPALVIVAKGLESAGNSPTSTEN
jgi:molecular chaperone GrpE